MVKNGVFFTIFLLLAASSFAQDMRNRYLFIEGSASRMEHIDFFKRSFAMEASGTGYIITNSVGEALHTLRFRVDSNNDPDYELYTITMSLHRNADNAQLVTFDFSFASVDETYPFLRTLFLNAVTPIPIPYLTEENLEEARGDHWYKWIYLRASFDYPITIYALLTEGLGGEKKNSLFHTNPSTGKTDRMTPIGGEIKPMPGAMLGLELQLLNFMSFEFDFQMSVGGTRQEDEHFVNTGIGAGVKVPVKFRNVMLVPYGCFFYSLNVSPIFSEFPRYAAGPGVQLCARAGKRGILFLDVQYLFSFGEAIMHNPYVRVPGGREMGYPEPEVIHYIRSKLGMGIGYKFGIIDRPKKTATFTY